MGLFGLFKKDKEHKHKGFHDLSVSSLHKLTSETVQVTFDVPEELRKAFVYQPGQHLEVIIPIGGKEERRSYSICSETNEPLSFAVKSVENGLVSKWFNEELKAGMQLTVSEPKGSFVLPSDAKNIVAVAAGSGITPIMAMAKAIETHGGNMRLFYGNRTRTSIIFKSVLDGLKNTFTTHFLSAEDAEGFEKGRIDKDTFTQLLKSDLSLLRADAYFLCGPEEMIIATVDVLNFFGVPEKKIHFELFTPPVLMKQEKESPNTFSGISHVKVILDGDVTQLDLSAKGKTILEAVEAAGLDAPYSCKGGVCSSCRAKVLIGNAVMTNNYSLTDEEVKKGYILTCQAHPATEELTVSYDD
ncbi:MAG: 2Fe-2S iron-sulfur cluster-binding protein [Bacteroidota bacterium]